MRKQWIDHPEHKPALRHGPFLLFLVLIMLALSAGVAQAEKTAKAPKPVGLVNSSNGSVYEKGEHGVIFKFFYFEEDQLYKGSDKIDFTRPKKGEKPGKKCYERTTEQYQLTFRVGVFENFDARLIVPFFNKKLNRLSFKKGFTDDTSGIGDIKLISRYRILSQKKKDPFNLALGVGLKMPTGSTDEEDSSGACPGFLQTGSGSWDPIIELGAHKVMGRHFLASHFMYQMATEGKRGDQDFKKPDVFKYNFGYACALSEWFDLGIEINGVIKSKAELDGLEQENSGGHVVYLSPGASFKFYKGMHLGVSVPIPVYRDLNGTQLIEDYRIVTKLAFKF